MTTYTAYTYVTATLVPLGQAPHGRCKAHRSAYHFPQQKMRFRDRQRFGKGWYRGFLKWWHPTTIGFPTKNDHFGVFWGYLYFLWSRWRLQISYISKPGSLGKWSNLTHIFQLSWNHHPDDIFVIFGCLKMRNSMEFPINICVSMHFFKWKTSWDLWTVDINTERSRFRYSRNTSQPVEWLHHDWHMLTWDSDFCNLFRVCHGMSIKINVNQDE